MSAPAYLWGQLSRALNADNDRRMGKVLDAIAGINAGRIAVGDPVPTKGMPAWVTPEIIRGGFATGHAAASGPLTDSEQALAAEHGIPATRAALFQWALTDAGLTWLQGLLDQQTYQVRLPEQAALLTVAHLLRTGHPTEAAGILDTIRPYADKLQFLPTPLTAPVPDGVHIATIGDAVTALEQKKPRRQVETQRIANSIWNPFTDELVKLWWDTRDDAGTIGRTFPDFWGNQAQDLLDVYAALSDEHDLPSRHRKPGSTVQILLTATRATLAGDRTQIHRARTVVGDVVAKRGAPGSETLQTLRRAQQEDAAKPSHAAVAKATADALRPHADVLTNTPLDLIAGTPGEHLPFVRRTVDRARHAPIGQLIHVGIITSAEGLAEVAPQLAGSAIAARYTAPIAGPLAAATFSAFQNRRTVLLLNYQTQVQVTALPWYQALTDTTETTGSARNSLVRQANTLAKYAIESFPGTVLPNAFLRVIAELYRQADLALPVTYELAADIFMGGFSKNFVDAARIAHDYVAGGRYTLYARYYGLSAHAPADTHTFAEEAYRRAGITSYSRWGSNAVAGSIIEQAQILTTHNLALVVHTGTTIDWETAANAAFIRTVQPELYAAQQKHGLRQRKNAAYAWRQVVFYLTMAGPDVTDRFLEQARKAADRHRAGAASAALLDDLERAHRDEPIEKPFYGWVTRTNDR
ncbi:hypothetical protein ACWGJ9_09465 [Curtobacterium citreum]